MENKRLIVGISGASGAELGIRLLEELRRAEGWESHLILSDAARETVELETKRSAEDVEALADKTYGLRDIGAAPSSGSWPAEGMIVIPCSMKTLAGIHSGYSDNLLLRAADTTLKEGRKLVLCPRESPFSPIHLRNMAELSLMGVMIVPPLMTFYIAPHTVEDMVQQYVRRLLGYFGIAVPGYRSWDGKEAAER